MSDSRGKFFRGDLNIISSVLVWLRDSLLLGNHCDRTTVNKMSIKLGIIYWDTDVSQYIIPNFILILFTLVWFGPILEKAILIVWLNCKKDEFEL